MSKTILAIKIQKQLMLEKVDSEIKMLQDKQQEINDALLELQNKLDYKDLNSLAIIPELEISRMNFSIHIHQTMDAHRLTQKQLAQDISRLEQHKLKINTELKHIERYEEKKQEQQAITEKNQSWNQLDEHCLR